MGWREGGKGREGGREGRIFDIRESFVSTFCLLSCEEVLVAGRVADLFEMLGLQLEYKSLILS